MSVLRNDFTPNLGWLTHSRYFIPRFDLSATN